MKFPKIVPCLWFGHTAEEAARFYCGIFPNSRISKIAYYGKAGFEQHQMKEGTVLTVQFQLDGQEVTALNGGDISKFNEAVSLPSMVDHPKDIDHYRSQLGQGRP